MRWHRRENGGVFTFNRFLWLPMRCGDETRWLERAIWTAKYQRLSRAPWRDHKWVNP